MVHKQQKFANVNVITICIN